MRDKIVSLTAAIYCSMKCINDEKALQGPYAIDGSGNTCLQGHFVFGVYKYNLVKLLNHGSYCQYSTRRDRMHHKRVRIVDILFMRPAICFSCPWFLYFESWSTVRYKLRIFNPISSFVLRLWTNRPIPPWTESWWKNPHPSFLPWQRFAIVGCYCCCQLQQAADLILHIIYHSSALQNPHHENLLHRCHSLLRFLYCSQFWNGHVLFWINYVPFPTVGRVLESMFLKRPTLHLYLGVFLRLHFLLLPAGR